MAGNKPMQDFIALRLAVVTVSDTRTEDNDTSGQFLRDALLAAGHHCHSKHICPDDVYQLRALVAGLIADPQIHA
ncbi:MAG TPA: molybdopterin-binding protein, partial [Hyphomicrobiales bacterium]|nr:molybdopterin-binding protein [Hyphomicrobiales bacterium]